MSALDDSEPEVRFWSIFALAAPENVDLLRRLKRLTRDSTPVPGWWTVGQEARWAMNWIRGKDLDVDPSEL